MDLEKFENIQNIVNNFKEGKITSEEFDHSVAGDEILEWSLIKNKQYVSISNLHSSAKKQDEFR